MINRKRTLALALVLLISLSGVLPGLSVFASEDVDSLLDEVNSCEMPETLQSILEENAAILELDMTAYSAMPEQLRQDTIMRVLNDRAFADVATLQLSFARAVVLTQIQYASWDTLEQILQENAAILGLDMTAYSAMPEQPRQDVIARIWNDRGFTDAKTLQLAFATAVVLTQVQYASWDTLEQILQENMQLLGLDMTDYLKLNSSQRQTVLRFVVGNYYHNAEALVVSVQQSINRAKSSGSGGGGKGGGGSVSPNVMPVYLWDIYIRDIDHAAYGGEEEDPETFSPSVYIGGEMSGVLVFTLSGPGGVIRAVRTQAVTGSGRYGCQFPMPQDADGYVVCAYLLTDLETAQPLSYVVRRALAPITDYVVTAVDMEQMTVEFDYATHSAEDISVAYQGDSDSFYAIKPYSVLSHTTGTSYVLSLKSYSGMVWNQDRENATISMDGMIFDADYTAIGRNGSTPYTGQSGRLLLNSARVAVGFVPD